MLVRPSVTVNRYGTVANRVFLPGSSGNYASAPDSVAMSVTGDIDVRVKVAAADWTPASAQTLASVWQVTGNQRSWQFNLATTGNLQLIVSLDGATNASNVNSGAATGFSDGTPHWVRFTRAAATGTVQFFTSDDYDPLTELGTWSQLGTDQDTADGSLFDSNADLALGAVNAGSGTPLAGYVYYAELRDEIDGDVVAKFDPLGDDIAPGDASFAASTGEVWTINRSGSPAAILHG